MAITITLEANAYAPAGVDFNAYFTSYFSDFVGSGFPYMLGGSGQFEGEQVVLLDEVDGADTRSLILDGEEFEYYFNAHTLSGTLTDVRLSHLGSSYDAASGSFSTGANGLISDVATPVAISGLSIQNAYGESGDVHEVIAALMGGGHSGGGANPDVLAGFIWAEGHNVLGSSGNDSYVGTQFDDTMTGNAGNDEFDGGAGSDTAIFGGAAAAYLVSANADGSVTVADQRAGSPDGTDILRNVEFARFADSVLDLSTVTPGTTPTEPVPVVQRGTAGDDTISGGAGADKIRGLAGDDTLRGKKGDDTLIGGKGKDKLFGNAGDDTLRGNSGKDVLKGGSGSDLLKGGTGHDKLYGGPGDDVLNGNKGDDTLVGQKGADMLKGGGGSDTFLFGALGHSSVGKKGRDTILDFSRKQGDEIDLSKIDAKKGVKGNQDFDFIGKSKFSDEKGELRYSKKNGDVFVYGDVDGDGKADFAIHLVDGPNLKVGDFVL